MAAHTGTSNRGAGAWEWEQLRAAKARLLQINFHTAKEEVPGRRLDFFS